MPTLEKPCVQIWDVWLCQEDGKEDWIEVVEWTQPAPRHSVMRITTDLGHSAEAIRAQRQAELEGLQGAIDTALTKGEAP